MASKTMEVDGYNWQILYSLNDTHVLLRKTSDGQAYVGIVYNARTKKIEKWFDDDNKRS